MSRLLISAILLSVLSIFGVHSARAEGVPGISEPVTFKVIPEYPAPRQTVYIQAESFITDLDKAVFTWTVNNKAFKKEVGLKEISFDTGAPGTLTSVSVEISTPDFGTIKNTFSFRPAEVTLLWQSDTYVPPFYQGKALHSFNGSYKVTAVPEFIDAAGRRVNPKNLVYTWKKNGEVQGDASGYGKDSFVSSQTSYLREGDDISVEVSSPKESMTGTASTSIVPRVPEIVFYEDSPLFGLTYEKALGGTFALTGEEMTLRAEPFNISTPTSLSMDWFLNGSSLSNFRDKDEITVRTTGDSGRSDITLRVQSLSKILQGGKASLTILQ